MTKKELIDFLIADFAQPKIGALATLKDGEPWVRMMKFKGNGKDLRLYTSSYRTSRKVIQIQKHGNVHITKPISGDLSKESNPEMGYAQIVAIAKIRDDDEIKKWLWSEGMKFYFKGPDDERLVVIEYNPTYIEYLPAGIEQPIVLQL